MTAKPPAVLCPGTAELDEASRVLAAEGWTVRDGLELPDEPWDLTRRRWACKAVVETADDALAAIWAMVRGCALTVVYRGPQVGDFINDLERCGELRQERRDDRSGLAIHEQALLASLAEGLSVQQAAAKLFLSTRTAQRRLLSARATLRVRTTREAVLAWKALARDQA